MSEHQRLVEFPHLRGADAEQPITGLLPLPHFNSSSLQCTDANAENKDFHPRSFPHIRCSWPRRDLWLFENSSQSTRAI